MAIDHYGVPFSRHRARRGRPGAARRGARRVLRLRRGDARARRPVPRARRLRPGDVPGLRRPRPVLAGAPRRRAGARRARRPGAPPAGHGARRPADRTQRPRRPARRSRRAASACSQVVLGGRARCGCCRSRSSQRRRGDRARVHPSPGPRRARCSPVGSPRSRRAATSARHARRPNACGGSTTATCATSWCAAARACARSSRTACTPVTGSRRSRTARARRFRSGHAAPSAAGASPRSCWRCSSRSARASWCSIASRRSGSLQRLAGRRAAVVDVHLAVALRHDRRRYGGRAGLRPDDAAELGVARRQRPRPHARRRGRAPARRVRRVPARRGRSRIRRCPGVAAAVAYAVNPIARNAIAEGELGPLVCFALAPFVMHALMRAAGASRSTRRARARNR